MFFSAGRSPDVVVTFAEKRSRAVPRRPLEFGITLNVNTWKVGQLYGANPLAKLLIEDSVTGLNVEHQHEILIRTGKDAASDKPRVTIRLHFEGKVGVIDAHWASSCRQVEPDLDFGIFSESG